MTALLAALLAAPPAARAPAPAPAPASIGGSGDTAFTYLVGGIRVIQQVDTSTRLVAVGVYLLGGTRLLTPMTAGIEELFLDAAARGSKAYPRGRGIRALARTGTIETFAVDEDWTAVWLQGFAADIDSSWAVLADELVNPTLSDTLVGLARDGLLAAARTRYQDPEQRIRALAESVMFAGHPYAVDPRGNPTSLDALTAADVRTFDRTELVGSRLMVVVVGDVTREHLTALIQSTLGTLPVGSYHWSLPPELPYREGRAAWIVENRPLPTTYLLGYCTGPQPSQPTYWPFRIAISIYSGWLSGSIRGQGLSYEAYAPFLDRALPVGGFAMSTSAPDRAFPLAMQALNDLSELQIGSDETTDESDQRWWWFARQVRHDYLNDLRDAQSTVLGTVDVLARAQLFFGDYRKVGALTPGASAFDDRSLANAAALCRSRLQYAYLGDSTKMHGKW